MTLSGRSGQEREREREREIYPPNRSFWSRNLLEGQWDIHLNGIRRWISIFYVRIFSATCWMSGSFASRTANTLAIGLTSDEDLFWRCSTKMHRVGFIIWSTAFVNPKKMMNFLSKTGSWIVNVKHHEMVTVKTVTLFGKKLLELF